MATSSLPILDRLSALADATRGRLLFVLDRQELTVGELCAVLQLPQSTVSRHLKVLADDGWVTSRAEGTSRRYRVAERLEQDARRLWQVVRESLASTAGAAHDLRRLERVVAERSSRARDYFRGVAGEWDRVRTELFGRRADLLALLALLPDTWTVGDLGCGTGVVAEVVAPHVARVIAVDESDAMLGAARQRLAGVANVELRAGALEALPIADGALDAAVLSLVLHYLPDPRAALAEAARTLAPTGRLLVMDMLPHEREEYREAMGHVWPGFPEATLRAWLADAGLAVTAWHPLPPDPAAKGPALFSCVARRA